MTQTTDAALVERMKHLVAPKDWPEAEGLLTAQARRIEALEGALRECADDLEVEVAERYKGWGDHPAIAPKVERDMAPVEAARALLSKPPTP